MNKRSDRTALARRRYAAWRSRGRESIDLQSSCPDAACSLRFPVSERAKLRSSIARGLAKRERATQERPTKSPLPSLETGRAPSVGEAGRSSSGASAASALASLCVHPIRNDTSLCCGEATPSSSDGVCAVSSSTMSISISPSASSSASPATSAISSTRHTSMSIGPCSDPATPAPLMPSRSTSSSMVARLSRTSSSSM
eukprot:scaffold118183_cov25-Tisochrysis_lutea.AAC.2